MDGAEVEWLESDGTGTIEFSWCYSGQPCQTAERKQQPLALSFIAV